MERPELIKSSDLPSTSSISNNPNEQPALIGRSSCNQIGWTIEATDVSLEEPSTSHHCYSEADSAEISVPKSSYSMLNNSTDGDNIPENESVATTLDSTRVKPEKGNDVKEGELNDESLYECNICLDTAKDAVVSMCGHLFCWPCLHQWLLTRPNRKLCPVCKASVDKDKVIPLYGRNSMRREDPRNKIPPRPAGQRTEPEPTAGFPGFGFGEGFHMSFGIGAFPFGFITSSLNFGEPRPPAANRGTTQYEDEQTLSKLFLYLAFLCIGWLLFA
ncbi:hypothetical protein KR074_005371 [Drosophila pseudoananassae]|nr:hypothetical protein KR074_005371 [Drosophila pseudoananassae]